MTTPRQRSSSAGAGWRGGPPAGGVGELPTHLLTAGAEAEVTAFLAERPVHTVFMASLIRDNGLESPLNRGSFYACRGEGRRLEGVALIGHATLIEARSEAALAAFARVAQECSLAHLVRGEQEKVEYFWSRYSETGATPRLVCRELLLEQRVPPVLRQYVKGLRLATPADINQIMEVNAAMAFEESGVNPMERDPDGFRRRTARRVELGRYWVWTRRGRLVFKADVIAETPEAAYLEGIYVNPEERGKGYGLSCMSQLGRTLLARTGAVCLTVNEQVRNTLSFYSKAGYRLSSYYDTIYLQGS
jgi:uncharacterized protein